MNVAGTPFELCDLREEWDAFYERIQRTETPSEEMAVLQRVCSEENSVALRCPDGLIVMSISAESGGRITAELALGVSFGDLGAFRKNEEHLVAIARDFGADRLIFETYRRGWFRLLGNAWTFDGRYFVRSL